MVKTLDGIITALEPIALLVCVTLWIYALVCFIRKNKRSAIVAGACFALIIAVMMTLADILIARARGNMLRFLDDENGPFTLVVEGQPVAETQTDSLLSVLRSVHPDRDVFHSHPTDMVEIHVADHLGRAINLALGRDSGQRQEYWLFQTDYETTSNNQLGRVVTPLLDKFPAAGER